MIRQPSASRRVFSTIASVALLVLCQVASAAQGQPVLGFPGAQGWAATTPGGRGGKIIKVTTLAASGPGSLREAIEAKGPRIVVFEVGGVIDLDRETLQITEPFITIAGQTAPSPGITIIRAAGVAITTHDVIVQHLRLRPGDLGEPKAGGWSSDAIRTSDGSHDVIIDHCTLTWATNKNVAASGSRFAGNTPDEWRAHTSHRITISANIIAEALSRSTHWKVEHSKGALIHDNTTDIAIIGNLFAHNYERSPLFKGGVRGVVVNNLIFDPGQRAIHYNLIAEEWAGHPYQVGQLAAVGNVLRAGMSTPAPIAFLELGGAGDLEYYGHDNIAVDQLGRPMPLLGRYTTSRARVIELEKPPLWPEGLKPLPADEVEIAVLNQVGARPWDRDYHDARLVADVAEGRGWIIDSQEDVHGYPKEKPTQRQFKPSDWDLATMAPRRAEVLDSAAKNTTLMVPTHE
jgi:pectate lyase